MLQALSNVTSILAEDSLILSQQPFDIHCHWWSKVKQQENFLLAKHPFLGSDWIWQMQTKTVPSIATVRQNAADSCKS